MEDQTVKKSGGGKWRTQFQKVGYGEPCKKAIVDVGRMPTQSIQDFLSCLK